MASGPITLNVDTTADLVYAAAANVNSCPIGKCSLRRAIQVANFHTDGTVTTINVPAGVYTLTRAKVGDDLSNAPDDTRNGDLHVSNSRVVLTGAGPGKTIIEQGPLVIDRVFTIEGEYPSIAQLRMSGVTIRGGRAQGETARGIGNDGGGIRVDGRGALELFNAEVVNNQALGGPGFEGPLAGGFGGAVAVDGDQLTSAVLHEVTIANNRANHGGAGLGNTSGSMVVYNSTVNGNQCLLTCTGGGIYAGFAFNVSNSTISGNSALKGGGIAVDTSKVVVNNSTVSNNSVTAGPGGAGADIWVNVEADLTLGRDIVSGASGQECSTAGSGKIRSAGSNLDQGLSCGFTALGDKHGVNPALGPLAANGGPTMTRAIGPGSPALDAVVGNCPPPSLDQRGIRRGSIAAGTGTRCDIGAYEYVGTIPPTTVASSVPTIIETFLPALPLAGSGLPDPPPGRAAWPMVALAALILPIVGRTVYSRLCGPTRKP